MANTSRARSSRAQRKRAGAQATRNRRLGIGGGIAAAALLVVVAIAAGQSSSPDGQPDVDAIGAPSGEVALQMLDGSEASLADYRGRPLVVNFFASWCVPCLAELPGFERVHQEMDGQVAFLGINLQDRPEDGRRVVAQTGVTYDIARDPDGSIFQELGAFAMPTTVFIAADGTIVDLHSGEISAGALADRIDEVLLT